MTEFEVSGSSSEEEDEEEIILGDKKKSKRELYYDKETMEEKLTAITSKLAWIHHVDISTDTSKLQLPTNKDNKEEVTTEIQDDFKREMQFYCQAQEAAKEALAKLRTLNVPTERPEDYFAEMVKSDSHMQKVRAKLVARKEGIEKSEKAKKQRQLKKIGKKIQQEVLQKRQQDKKKMLQAVDRLKKGKNKTDDANADDIFNVSANKTKGKQMEPSIRALKRKHKDEKFGFGGKKRKLKKNDAGSSKDMSSFKPHVHNKSKNYNSQGRKVSGGGKTKRLGKSRRKGAKK